VKFSNDGCVMSIVMVAFGDKYHTPYTKTGPVTSKALLITTIQPDAVVKITHISISQTQCACSN
jgi:hypothetical protein